MMKEFSPAITKMRKREKSLTHDNLMADILIFLPSLFFQALERESSNFTRPTCVFAAVVFQRRGRELYTQTEIPKGRAVFLICKRTVT